MWPGFDSRTRCHMWVEFVVGSRPCSKKFFSGYSGFPLSSKTNTFKFQFDLDYCQALYHEPLAREIEQVLPVLLALNRLLFFQARFITTLLSPHVILRLCPRSDKTTAKISCKFFRVSCLAWDSSLIYAKHPVRFESFKL